MNTATARHCCHISSVCQRLYSPQPDEAEIGTGKNQPWIHSRHSTSNLGSAPVSEVAVSVIIAKFRILGLGVTCVVHLGAKHARKVIEKFAPRHPPKA